MGPSVTYTLVTALTKLSTSQEAMDNRLNEMSKKFEERNTTLTSQFNDFQENQTEQPQRGTFRKAAAITQFFQAVITEEVLEATSEVIIENSVDLDRTINDVNGRIEIKVHIRHDSSHI